MDNKSGAGSGLFCGISELIKSEISRRKSDTTAVFYDIIIFLISAVFARCHVVFGVYPLATALVSVLSRGVWIAAVGAVVGALSLGGAGIAHALVVLVAVLLRALVSGREEAGACAVFCEPLLFRISSAAAASFVGGIYELFYRGFSLVSILYGAVYVLLSAALTFLLSGIYDGGVSFRAMIFESSRLLDKKKNDREHIERLFFLAALFLFYFLISFSLKPYGLFGINLSYVFCGAVTLFMARRFGALFGMATGFVTTIAVSGTYSVAFALAGLAAGFLFSLNLAYALISGGVLLSLWGIYSNGAMGLLTVFPEYVTAALLTLPLLKRLSADNKKTSKEEVDDIAENMVTATALTYRSAADDGLSELEKALCAISLATCEYLSGRERVELSEYRDAVIDGVSEFCRSCLYYEFCKEKTPAPCAENVENIATKLYKNEHLSIEDGEIIPDYCQNAKSLIEKINFLDLEIKEMKSRRFSSFTSEEYEFISRLIKEVRQSREREKTLDVSLTNALLPIVSEVGLGGGIIRAFGERKKHFICAGRDADGSIVTSPALRRGIEETAGIRLGVPEFYRKKEVALFECSAIPKYRVEIAFATRRAFENEVSGDTVLSFESKDGHFYSLVSDGMGSGDAARKVSRFVAEFLSSILSASPTKNTALHMLNHIIRTRGEECSATVDLFDLDLYRGDALFFKCGAAASYVKRDSSIFRVRSETAPIGLMQTIDAERIRVEIKGGDYVVMISDGISQTSDDSAWLLEVLNKEPDGSLSDYANSILALAEERSGIKDDKSVAVLKICDVH